MTRRKNSFADDVVELTSMLPWWAGTLLAVVSYLWLHSIAVSEVVAATQLGQMGEAVRQSIFRTLATIGQYLLSFLFLVGAGLSAFERRKRQALHKAVTASTVQNLDDHLPRLLLKYGVQAY